MEMISGETWMQVIGRKERKVAKGPTPPTTGQKAEAKKIPPFPSHLFQPFLQIGPYGAKKEEGAEKKSSKDCNRGPDMPKRQIHRHHGESESQDQALGSRYNLWNNHLDDRGSNN